MIRSSTLTVQYKIRARWKTPEIQKYEMVILPGGNAAQTRNRKLAEAYFRVEANFSEMWSKRIHMKMRAHFSQT